MIAAAAYQQMRTPAMLALDTDIVSLGVICAHELPACWADVVYMITNLTAALFVALNTCLPR